MLLGKHLLKDTEIMSMDICLMHFFDFEQVFAHRGVRYYFPELFLIICDLVWLMVSWLSSALNQKENKTMEG